MIEMMFEIDGGNKYKGFSQGQRWNGWECPYFPLEVAQQIAKDMSNFSDKLTYDETKDCFTYKTEDYPQDESDSFDSTLIDGKKLYAIGAFSWCWDGEPVNP